MNDTTGQFEVYLKSNPSKKFRFNLPIYVFSHEDHQKIMNPETDGRDEVVEKHGFHWSGGGDPYPFAASKDWKFVKQNRWDFHYTEKEYEEVVPKIEAVLKSLKFKDPIKLEAL
ncbi:MAG: hypothetical protein GY810_04725 [Aureispira sp.]|nr:hypothetical protein [Aureispira sp.]